MLTIGEEVLLLALDYDTGRFSRVFPERHVNAALGGAVLMDLSLLDRIDTDPHRLFVVDPSPVGEPALDHAMSRITAEDEPQATDHWVNALVDDGEALRGQLVDRLVDRGVLVRDRYGRLLVMAAHGHAASDGAPYRDVRRRLAGVLMNDEMPDPRDVMIISLAETCELWNGLVDDAALPCLAPRIRDLAQLDLIGQAVARVLDARRG